MTTENNRHFMSEKVFNLLCKDYDERIDKIYSKILDYKLMAARDLYFSFKVEKLQKELEELTIARSKLEASYFEQERERLGKIYSKKD